jgi:hypothetical protein
MTGVRWELDLVWLIDFICFKNLHLVSVVLVKSED